MPKIIHTTLTKEKENEKYERLKGKGLESPCYLQIPIKKPKNIVMK